MTRSLRWRIITLQAVLVAVFGLLTGLAFWGSNFVKANVHDQLASQQIYFPVKGSPALDPKAFPDLQQYAGQQVVNGDQAKAYSDGFIQRHLDKLAGGETYAQLSAESQANPSDTKLAAQVATMFKGTTLRGMLLNAYAWWQVGVFAFYAAIGLGMATLIMFAALAFEVAVALRGRPMAAPAPAVAPRTALQG